MEQSVSNAVLLIVTTVASSVANPVLHALHPQLLRSTRLVFVSACHFAFAFVFVFACVFVLLFVFTRAF